MPNIFICYPKCSTCQKARGWLTLHAIPFEERHIKDQPPTEKELAEWIKKSGLPSARFFNTSGRIYREQGLSSKLPNMTEDEKIATLSTDGMLVKRPIFVMNNTVLVGFKEKEWEAMAINPQN